MFYRLIAISVSAISLDIIDNFLEAEGSAKITIYRLSRPVMRSVMSTYQ